MSKDTRSPYNVSKGEKAELAVIEFARDFLGQDLFLNEDIKLNYKGCDLYDRNDPTKIIDVKSYNEPIVFQYSYANRAFSMAQPFRPDNISTHIYIYDKYYEFVHIYKTKDYINMFISDENLIKLREFYDTRNCSDAYEVSEFDSYMQLIFMKELKEHKFFKPGIEIMEKHLKVDNQIAHFKISLKNHNK